MDNLLSSLSMRENSNAKDTLNVEVNNIKYIQTLTKAITCGLHLHYNYIHFINMRIIILSFIFYLSKLHVNIYKNNYMKFESSALY